jgi:hypothetical protein
LAPHRRVGTGDHRGEHERSETDDTLGPVSMVINHFAQSPINLSASNAFESSLFIWLSTTASCHVLAGLKQPTAPAWSAELRIQNDKTNG